MQAETFNTAEAQEAIRELPFVSETDLGDPAYWNIDEVGDVNDDAALGEMYGALALAVAKRFNLPLLLAMIIRDMVKAGRFTGVEGGFLAVIVSAAKAGSMN